MALTTPGMETAPLPGLQVTQPQVRDRLPAHPQTSDSLNTHTGPGEGKSASPSRLQGRNPQSSPEQGSAQLLSCQGGAALNPSAVPFPGLCPPREHPQSHSPGQAGPLGCVTVPVPAAAAGAAPLCASSPCRKQHMQQGEQIIHDFLGALQGWEQSCCCLQGSELGLSELRL